MAAGVIIVLIGYQNLFVNVDKPLPVGTDPTFEKAKNVIIFLTGFYVIFAGGLKVYQAKPKKKRKKKL
jgi:hypothetical protein